MDRNSAYEKCIELGRDHYENFTVVSRLLPRQYRKYVYALYAYCRHTDDLGDEYGGDREEKLKQWEQDLDCCFSSTCTPSHPILLAVDDLVQRFGLPADPFYKLIEANRMDQKNESYETYQDLLYYCDHSANPVGKLFLAIFGYQDERRQQLSDSTCTGLQLTNFWQDVWRDYQKGRIYIPQEDLRRFDYSSEELSDRRFNENFKRLMEFEVGRARELLREGLRLPPLLDDRIKADVTLFNKGGLGVLDKIEELDYDVLNVRPTISTPEKVWLFVDNYFRSLLTGDSRDERTVR